MCRAIAVTIAAFMTLVVTGAGAAVLVRERADTTSTSSAVTGSSAGPCSRRAAGRLIVIISDLHLGLGRDPATGQWQPTEDFRWADAFGAFLRAINQAGRGSTDLVLNGDTFELWQPLGSECRHPNVRLGCTEAEALSRLERVLAAHATEIADLGAFARTGGNRVTIVRGDHDAALFFPTLSERVVAAVNAPGRVDVAAQGNWVSADGAVYAEHGHQMPGDPFRVQLLARAS